MIFDSLRDRAGGRAHLAPMEIAHHTLLTAREKIELLDDLKMRSTACEKVADGYGYSAEEVDAAIAEVRMGTQNGEPTRTVLFGDN